MKLFFQGILKTKNHSITTFALTITSILNFSNALALECKLYSVTEIYSNSDAVFIGRPIWIEDAGSAKRIVTFSVKEAWKGIDSKTVRMVDAGTIQNYEIFEDYLVFPKTKNTDGVYSSSICPQSIKLSPQFEVLRKLDGIRHPQKISSDFWQDNALSDERSPEWVKKKQCLSFAVQERNRDHNCF